MAKTKISEFSATPANNTDIDSINIAEGCAPSGINDAIRELMAQLKDFQTGAVGDSFNGPIGATTASTGAFTTLSSTGNTTLGDASGDAVTINGTATFANANPTLTAGTANGVTFLNGSKVLTSGSGLVFDGTNLGLGVTPSAWGSSKAIQIGTRASLFSFNNASTDVGNNTYLDGSDYRYLATAASTFYRQNAGIHVWNYAASGTAGAVITYSEGMRLDASGGLQIGRTSVIGTSNRLAIQMSGTSASGYTAATNASLAIDAGTSTNTVINMVGGGDMGIYHSNSSNAYDVGISLGSNADRIITFTTANAERARIDSSGRLLVGTTSSISTAGLIQSAASNTTTVSSTYIWNSSDTGIALRNTSNTTNSAIGLSMFGGSGGNSAAAVLMVQETANSTGALAFYTGGSGVSSTVPERARIDSSGKLLVATTTVIDSARMTIKGSATVINAQTETDGSYVLRVTNAAGSGVGGVVANSSSTSYLTSSDYRLKNTIAPMTGALAKVSQLKPVTYKWNCDGSHSQGFIAHELQAVVPDAVVGEKDAIDDEGNIKPQGIDTSFLVATLTAAIQELKAEFDAYKASHP